MSAPPQDIPRRGCDPLEDIQRLRGENSSDGAEPPTGSDPEGQRTVPRRREKRREKVGGDRKRRRRTLRKDPEAMEKGPLARSHKRGCDRDGGDRRRAHGHRRSAGPHRG